MRGAREKKVRGTRPRDTSKEEAMGRHRQRLGWRWPRLCNTGSHQKQEEVGLLPRSLQRGHSLDNTGLWGFWSLELCEKKSLAFGGTTYAVIGHGNPRSLVQPSF